MTNPPLTPALQNLAEQYLGRPLQPQEAQTLATFQQSLQNPPAPPLAAVQQAQQQTQRAIAQGKSQATASVRDILSSIQASSSQALHVQEAEEQAILKLLEGTQSLAELRPSALQPGMGNLQAGSQLAISQIAEHLSNLARQEVEQCFQQYFGPLSAQLQEVVMKLQAMDALPPAAPSAAAPAAQSTAQPAAAPVAQAPAAAANEPAADIHSPSAPPSMP